jgi:hypothetical protein
LSSSSTRLAAASLAFFSSSFTAFYSALAFLSTSS